MWRSTNPHSPRGHQCIVIVRRALTHLTNSIARCIVTEQHSYNVFDRNDLLVGFQLADLQIVTRNDGQQNRINGIGLNNIIQFQLVRHGRKRKVWRAFTTPTV